MNGAVRDVLIRLGVDPKKAKRGCAQVRMALKGVVAGAKATAFALMAIGVPLVYAAKQGAEFELKMAEIATIADAGAGEMAKMREQVIALALEMGKSPMDMARGLYQTISAGVGAADAMEFMTVAAKAAVGGVAEQAQTVDLLSSAINAYELTIKDASDVSDLMFQIVKKGKTTWGELSESMGASMKMAHQVGMSMEELGAMIASLTNVGVKTPEAMTAIRGALVAMIKPSGEMAEMIKKLGYDSALAAIKSESFAGVMEKIKQKTGGNAAALAKLFPRVRGLAAVLQITSEGGGKKFNEMLESMASKLGSSGKAFRTVAGSDAFKFQQALEAISTTVTILGAELLPGFAEAMENLGGGIGIANKIKLEFKGIEFVLGRTLTAISNVTAMILSAGDMALKVAGLTMGGIPITLLSDTAEDAKDRAYANRMAVERVKNEIYDISLADVNNDNRRAEEKTQKTREPGAAAAKAISSALTMQENAINATITSILGRRLSYTASILGAGGGR